MFSIVCRYLNSGFPVLVGGGGHAVVLTGWLKRGDKTLFVACDDQVGPYEVVDPFKHYKAPWQLFMVPMPPKVYAPAEFAEERARITLLIPGSDNKLPEWARFRDKLLSGALVLRTALLSNLSYKEALTSQGRAPDTVRALRLARLPHYVWVVEAHDRASVQAGRPRTVEAEVVFDPTSEDRLGNPQAISLPLLTAVSPPDGGKAVHVLEHNPRWQTLIPGPGGPAHI